jgi:hypothetical protein
MCLTPIRSAVLSASLMPIERPSIAPLIRYIHALGHLRSLDEPSPLLNIVCDRAPERLLFCASAGGDRQGRYPSRTASGHVWRRAHRLALDGRGDRRPHVLPSVREIGRYFGLSPCAKDSATVRRRGHITREGKPKFRAE